MEARTLRAHFDGRQIRLDEPFELEANTELLLTVLPEAPHAEREAWARLSLESLARIYGEDEPDRTALFSGTPPAELPPAPVPNPSSFILHRAVKTFRVAGLNPDAVRQWRAGVLEKCGQAVMEANRGNH